MGVWSGEYLQAQRMLAAPSKHLGRVAKKFQVPDCLIGRVQGCLDDAPRVWRLERVW